MITHNNYTVKESKDNAVEVSGQSLAVGILIFNEIITYTMYLLLKYQDKGLYHVHVHWVGMLPFCLGTKLTITCNSFPIAWTWMFPVHRAQVL